MLSAVPTLRNWLVALALCAVIVGICIHFVDIPTAKFVHSMPWTQALRVQHAGIPVMVVLAAIIVLALGGYALAGRPLSRLAQATMLAALSLGWAVCITELLLKPLFGRSTPDDLIATGLSSFSWFNGTMDSSFPSGHAVQIASVASVLWMTYARWRPIYALLAGGIMLILVLGNWHFVGDVVAGAFIGASAGLMIVNLWRMRAQAR